VTQSTDQLAPGLVETERQARTARPAAEAVAETRQAQAGTFIREHGHDAMHHVPVTSGQKTGG